MQPRIRAKFVGILIIAAVVPLCIAIVGVQILGHQYYKRERGRLYEAVARYVASSLLQSVERETAKLNDWVVLADPTEYLARQNAVAARWSDRETEVQATQWDRRWLALPERSPEIQAFLTNSVARTLRDFQSINPLFAEILVTDSRGQLIAATGKTTDYWQADEAWWQRAMKVRQSYAYLEGVSYDESAHVFSLDVCLPIRPRGQPNAAPIGIVKGVLNASIMFSSTPRLITDETTARQIVLRDGTFLFDLLLQSVPPFTMKLDVAQLELTSKHRAGWTVTRLDGETQSLVGFSMVDLAGRLVDPQVPAGLTPMYLLIHEDAARVLAPVHRQLRLLAVAGALILLLFATVGYYVATQKIIAPVELLRSAARMIAASAKLAHASTDEREVKVSPATAQLLERLQGINTKDELEDLARDFGSMARRVLSYHEQLEEELAGKTAEMQRDLDIAHEFQEALMPHSYPQVSSSAGTTGLRLNFHHEYRAASTVGGDFFDVHKLSDNRAGIFIADVMGHGARAALVTAILRTLLQDLAVQATDPAHFLALINQHFFDITSQSKQFVFASAFYMVVDTERAIASYASAGHPPPLLVDRNRRVVTPLIEHLENNPALGVFRDSTYTNFTSFVKENDLFLLFTDGLFEALNAEGQEFGRQRLKEIIERHINRDVTDITRSIMDTVSQFTGTTGMRDDICLVAVEVAGAGSLEPLTQDKR